MSEENTQKAPAAGAAEPGRPVTIALAGNPNCGKQAAEADKLLPPQPDRLPPRK